MISLKIDIPTNIPNASNAEVEQIIFDALLNFANISHCRHGITAAKNGNTELLEYHENWSELLSSSSITLLHHDG